MSQSQVSPLIRVSEASQILGEKPATTYYKVALKVFPDGVVVRLGASIRFHRQNLLRWLEHGGSGGSTRKAA